MYAKEQALLPGSRVMRIKSGIKHGFTLVEILVVLAIIVLLAAIVSSATLDGLASAKKSACASNLHQIYLAVGLYCGDQAGYMPPYNFNSFAFPKNIHEGGEAVQKTYELQQTKAFIDAVNPYAKSKKIWFCPADSMAGQDKFTPLFSHKYTSYNGVIGIGIVNLELFPTQVFNLDDPCAGKFGEINCKSATNGIMMMDIVIATEGDGGEYRQSWTGHGEFMNVLYIDGHVQSTNPHATVN